MAGSARKSGGREVGTRGFGPSKGGGEKAGRGRGSRGVAQGSQGAFSHGPRDRSRELRGPASPARVAQIKGRELPAPVGRLPAIYALPLKAHLWKPGF